MSQGNSADVDLVVVGAGLAGSVAAARAATLGARVLLLDQAEDPTAGGNTPMSGGSIHVAGIHVTSPPAEIRLRIDEATLGNARPDLADAVAANAGRALAWLLSQGISVETPNPTDRWRSILAPQRSFNDVHAWPGRGPHQALQRLQAVVRSFDGAVRGGTVARELLPAPDGGVGGIITEKGAQIGARAVILADGGFQANPELRKRYLGPAADRIFMRGARSGQGDGLRMAEAVGGRSINMRYFYGHCLHRGAVSNDRLWPMPLLDDLVVAGILVDARGRRFVDESLGGIAAANAIGRSADPTGTQVVLTRAQWEAAEGRSGATGQPAANPEILRRGGAIHLGDDVAALAAVAAIDAAGLVETISEYNSAVAAGKASLLRVPRTEAAQALAGPLIAIPLIPGITFTMGGLLIDRFGRVLGASEHPVSGLYAAGGTAGGLQGSETGGYVGGLAPALVFGLLAGESVVVSVRAASGVTR